MNRLIIPAALTLGALAVVWPTTALASRRSISKTYKKVVYPPGSDKQIALFERAAPIAGVSKSWASDPNFISLLKRESAGVVGIPNYQYGKQRKDPNNWPKIWADLRNGIRPPHSSATGLGQMILDNVDALYPNGRKGIGVPLDEAVGMLKYVKKRYGTPAEAWAFWKAHHWY